MGLRARLLLLVLLALAPTFALTLVHGLNERQAALQKATEDALRIVEQASADQEALIHQTQQLLFVLAQLPEVEDQDGPACSALVADVVGGYPFLANLGAFEADGDAFCSAVPLAGPVNASDRAWFRRTLAARDFAVGDYQIGRITGRPVLVLGYPALDPPGQVRSVVFTALDLAWLDGLVARAGLPEGSSLILLDRQGAILLRHPDGDSWRGRLVRDTALLQAIEAAGGQGTARVQGLDGVPRLFAFLPLADQLAGGATLAVGVPVEAAFAEVDQALIRTLGGLAIITFFSLALAWLGADLFLLRQVRALIQATQRLAAGDFTARNALPGGPGELGDLAVAFDEMARALEAREQALRESEEHFRTVTEGSLAGVYIIQDDVFQYVNPALARIFGYEPEEIIGRLGPADLTHPQDQPRVLEQIRRRLAGETLFAQYPFQGLRKDGTTVDCEVLGRRQEYRGRPAIVGTLLDVTERRRSEARVRRQLERLNALRAIDLAITASLDPRLTFSVLLEQVTAQLGVDAADILVFDEHTQTLNFAAGRGFRTDALQHTHLRLGQSHAGRAALQRERVFIPSLAEQADDLTRSPLLHQEAFVSYCAMPLVAKGAVRGVLELFHRAPLQPDPEWFDFLEALAGQAAIAIDNATLFDHLQRSNERLIAAYEATLEGWARALELRDHETEGHTRRVTDLTLRLARDLGVPAEDLVHIRRGALLHDIGKIAIPDHILLKPGPLTEAEWAVMRQHPVHAYELLSPIEFLRPALDIPYCHHERWDGNGYPRGLRGEAIPLAARIFAVADVWDALTSDRPYRKAWSPERALDHIRSQAGKHFDPDVVRVFLELAPEALRRKVR